MLGAIIGDMVGSVYEFNSIKTKKFNIFNINNRMTDDSMLTLAVAEVLSKYYPIDYTKENLEKIKKDLIKEFVETVKKDPGRGYGGFFYDWCKYNNNGYKPYNSYGNGSAMRISPVGWIANSEEEVKKLSKAVTEITHNHQEGIKGAEAVAMCIYLARTGKDKEYIKHYVKNNYYPEIDKLDFDELVKTYTFSVTCQKSVPQAIYCFLISNSMEDAIRNCIAIGGDCDTTGAMAGSIAEAYYQRDELSDFEKKFIYLQIDSGYINRIKKFYNMLNNKKLIDVR
ncbi:MAG: ADP-ribosylglycohydrolase family protein [Bacilli bacterium]|nr:ADP-ribosylglycohydrolase family protein [Bacilli bacterium]